MKKIVLKRLGILTLVAILLLIVPGSAIAADENGQPQTEATTGSESTKYFDEGPVFPAIERALAQEGPVKDDLINRGLFILPTSDGKGGEIPGEIKIGEIEKLINAGTYSIDETNTLVQGSQSPEQKSATSASLSYKYALMVTRLWGIIDQFSYRGHSAYVTIPANITLSPDTVHNLYTNHMGLPNGSFIESGVGWVSWASSPIIYTYSSYTGAWSYIPITSGISRDIYLQLFVNPTTYLAYMYVVDMYTLSFVMTTQTVSGLNHRVDQCQEECSSGTWTATPQVLQYNNQLVNTSNQWVNWNNSIPTAWTSNSPLHQNYGIQNDMKWINTWCTP